MYWRVPQVWEGETVAVLASGESMTQADADAVRHLPRVAINLTGRLAPDADVVYSSDSPFWLAYPDLLTHPGFKVCVEQRMGMFPNVPREIRVLRNLGQEGLSTAPEGIFTGGNSGYAAINLAVVGGAKRVLLLGMDMTGGHWHGAHAGGLGNPREHLFTKWIARFNRLAAQLKAAGIEVINCSPISVLECFARRPLSACL